MHLESFALIVKDYDDAIHFFVEALGFEVVEDSPATTNDGRPKRWVVVRPPRAQTGLLLAQADGQDQAGAVGRQFAGRVGLFLRVDDFDTARRTRRTTSSKRRMRRWGSPPHRSSRRLDSGERNWLIR